MSELDTSYLPVSIIEERCNGCMRCMRFCPTQAIRVRRGLAKIFSPLCLSCGECIKVCPENAILPLTDSFTLSENFDIRVAVPSPVLYSQFGDDVNPAHILAALRHIGFDYVCDIGSICELFSQGYHLHLQANRDRWPPANRGVRAPA